MKVVAMPADVSACGHLRVAWPAEVLVREGHDVGVVAPGVGSGLPALQTWHGKITDVVNIDADVIVVQRPMGRQLADVLRMHQKRGKRIVVDLDDDLAAVHPSNTAYATVQPKLSPNSNWQIAAEVCRFADMVTVTTPELARRYGSHGRVTVVPNCIPMAYLTIEKERLSRITLGWSGWVGTHPADLEVTRGAVQKAMSRTGAGFRCVGPVDGVQRALGLLEEPDASGWVEIQDWPVEVAKLDVGMAPLAPSRFNDAKSALKGLEYAALGVPFVASPTPAYQDLAAEGAGLLADKPKVWERHLRTLLNEPDARAALARAGRETARRFVIEDHAGDFWKAWTGEK